MAERGLHASIWASRGNGDTRYGPRPGDWECPTCGFSNYQRRTECFRCSQKGLKDVSANGHVSRSTTPNSYTGKIPQESGSWARGGISGSGGSSVQKEDSTSNGSHLSAGEQGLAMSRWAPRNYDGRPKVIDKRQVWTRVRLSCLHYVYMVMANAPVDHSGCCALSIQIRCANSSGPGSSL